MQLAHRVQRAAFLQQYLGTSLGRKRADRCDRPAARGSLQFCDDFFGLNQTIGSCGGFRKRCEQQTTPLLRRPGSAEKRAFETAEGGFRIALF